MAMPSFSKDLILLVLAALLGFAESLELMVGLEDRYAVLGESLWWTCSARRGNVQGNLSYRWRFEGEAVGHARLGIVDYGNGTIFISEVKYVNLGLYTCTATNGQNDVESQARLGQSYAAQGVDIQASGQSVSLGSNASIVCRFDAQPPARFRWLFKGREIRNAVLGVDIDQEQNGSTLKIESATYVHVGEYRCQVQHKLLLGPLQSQPVKMEVSGKPWLAFATLSQNVPVGYNATFKCIVYGVPRPVVAWTFTPSSPWQQELTLEPPATSSTAVGASTLVVDDNGASLNIVAAESATTGQYACRWTNADGSIRHVASLTVSSPPQPPVVTQSPGNVTVVVVEGEDLQVNCSGTGNPTPSVEWVLPSGDRVSQRPFQTESSLNDIAITPSGILVIRNVRRQHSGKHECILVNPEGNSSATTYVDVLFQPYSTEPPHSVVVDEGSTVEIRCQTYGNPQPSITWLPPWVDGVNDQWPLPSSSGFFRRNGSSLVIENVRQEHRGAYSCRADNSVGSVQRNAFITVRGPPVVVKSPSSVGAVEGDRIELTCLVSGFPVPSKTWHFLSLPDPSVEYLDMAKVMQYALFDRGNWTGEPMVDLSATPRIGSTIVDGSLVIPLARASDGGLYSCKARNSYGQSNVAAIVRVVTFPKFDKKPRDKRLLPGDDVLLDCVTSGIPIPSQTWLFNDRKINAEPRFTRYANGSLAITSIAERDFGNYTCLSTNEFGQRSVTSKLLMSSKPYLMTQPGNYTFAEFDHGILECVGESTGTFSTSWFLKDVVDGRDILIGNMSNHESALALDLTQNSEEYASRITVDKNGSLTFSCVEIRDAASYYCQVENQDGSTKSKVVAVNVISIARDINVTMPVASDAGDDVRIECDVRSLMPISISWITPKATQINASSSSFPGVVLKGAITTDDVSKSVLAISDLTNENHGGEWACKACNTIGCSLAKATLVIKDRPTISAFLASEGVDEISFQCLAVGVPTADIRYLVDGSNVNENYPGHRVIGKTLIVQKTRVQREYQCEAENSLGASRVVISKPSAMIVSRVIPYAERITIEGLAYFPLVHLQPSRVVVEYRADADEEWKTSEQTIDLHLTSYIDVFKNTQSKDARRNCSDIKRPSSAFVAMDTMELSVHSDAQTLTYSFGLKINDLVPYTSYSIRTFMENSISPGAKSSTVQVVTQASAPPRVANIEITVFNRSAWISWSNPDHMNGRIEDVTIRIDVFKSRDRSTVRRKTVAATGNTSLTFYGLAVSNYDVEITSINQRLKRSSEIASKTFLVEEDVPSFVPEIVELKSKAFYHAVITWTIPPEVGLVIPPVTGYSVVLSPKSKPNSDIVLDVEDAKISSLTLIDLKERQEYAVRIASRNSEGVGLYSTAHTFTTAFAPFSTLPLGGADLHGTSWKLVAIGIVASLVPIGFLAVVVAISIQVKLNRRGSAEITTESIDGRSAHEDPTSSDNVEGVMNSNFMLF